MARDEVLADTREPPGTQCLATHRLADVEQRAGGGIRRRQIPVHGRVVVAANQRVGIDRAAERRQRLGIRRLCPGQGFERARAGACEAYLHVRIGGNGARRRAKLLLQPQGRAVFGGLALQLRIRLHAVGIGPQRKPLAAMADNALGVALLDRAADASFTGPASSKNWWNYEGKWLHTELFGLPISLTNSGLVRYRRSTGETSRCTRPTACMKSVRFCTKSKKGATARATLLTTTSRPSSPLL